MVVKYYARLPIPKRENSSAHDTRACTGIFLFFFSFFRAFPDLQKRESQMAITCGQCGSGEGVAG
jgi:hypothetical protein